MGLLILGNPRQQVDMAYRFEGNQSDTRSSSDHRFYEQYRLDFDYAFFNPLLFNGHIGTALRLDQSRESTTGTGSTSDAGVSIMYDIGGTLLTKSATPVNFTVRSSIEDAPSSFGPGYQVLTDTYGVGAAIRNRYLPVFARFTRTNNETSGLPDDRKQTHDSFLIGARHSYRDLSATQLNLQTYRDRSVSVQGDAATSSSNYDFSLENRLTFENTALNSWFRAVDQAGDTPYRTWSWSESLTSDLGKALRGSLSYNHENRDILSKKSKTDAARASLQHRLFESVTTNLEVQGRREDSTDGLEQDVSGTVGVTYHKKLTAGSRLQVAVNKTYGVTDRDLLNAVSTVFNEEHPIGTFSINLFIPLANQEVLPTTIHVINKNPLRRPTPYDVGTDYVFDTIAGQKGIRLIGSDFIDNDVLLITYDVAINPKVAFATNTQGVGVDLNTHKGKYRYYLSWQNTKQTLLAGSADQVNLLDDYSVYTAGFERRDDFTTATVEYGRTDSDTENHQSVRGSLRRRGEIGAAAYSLYVTDIYTITTPNETTKLASQKTRSENFLNVGATYSRAVLENGVLLLNSDYAHVDGDAPRDDFASGCDLRLHYGKLTVSLLAQLAIRSSQGSTREEERFRMNIIRFF